MFNPDDIRKEFPILGRQVHGKPLVYLDNAATTQKPRCVIDAISEAYCTVNANVMNEEMIPTVASSISKALNSFARNASATRSAIKYSNIHGRTYARRERR